MDCKNVFAFCLYTGTLFDLFFFSVGGMNRKRVFAEGTSLRVDRGRRAAALVEVFDEEKKKLHSADETPAEVDAVGESGGVNYNRKLFL